MEVETRRGDHRTPTGGFGARDRAQTDCSQLSGTEAATGSPLFRVAPLSGEARGEEGTGAPDGERMNEGPFPSYVIFRCNRWGTYRRWLAAAGVRASKPKNVKSWWGPIVQDRNVAQDWRDPRDICPVDIPEALETQRCIDALPASLKEVMLQEHVVRGTQAEKAHALRIDRVTFWRRCQRAYGLLLGLFNDAGADLPLIEEKD